MSKPSEELVSSACNLCFVNCGIKVQLGGEDGREILKVRGDDDHPTSKGYICNKAARINYYQNNAGRLQSPMRRRADGSYEEIDWDTAISEIAGKLGAIRDEHGGERIFYYGGGAQGDHLGGAYAPSLRSALGIRYKGNAISQEKTGLAWVLSRMIGGTPHADLHAAQVVMFMGKNPFMSNGMDRARPFLRDIKKDESRTLIVVDPRRSETAEYADIHLAVHPGRDAWALAAMLGWLVQNDQLPMDWLVEHTSGYDRIIESFSNIPVDEFSRFAGLEPALVIEAAKAIADADSFALEEDLGVQQAPHSTLVTYLNHLLQLATGNYGKHGTMDLATQLAPILPMDNAPVDENGYDARRRKLPVSGAPIYSGLYPGAMLAEEILNDHPERPRAIFLESSNPVHSLPEAKKMREAWRSLECSVAIDVAMTETALECDYVLPAATNYEKWSATFFPRNFPDSIFHLRPPLMEPAPNTLIEPEIHARLIEALGYFEPGELDGLQEAASQGLDAYKQAFFEQMGQNPKIAKSLSYVLYRTLGPALPEGAAGSAALWGLCQMYTMKHPQAAARAGFDGADAGTDMFRALLESPTAMVIGISNHEESFSSIPHPDNKLQLVISELLDEIPELHKLEPLLKPTEEYPFALVAGSRRAYTANCAIRDPRWMKGKNPTALTINPADAERFDLPDGALVTLQTEAGSTTVPLAYDEAMHPGTLSVPNGQGMSFTDENGETLEGGVFANELTSAKYRDKFIGTPFHKFVPARVSLAG